MSGTRSVTSFDTLRAWDGSQFRAFEELAYQLLKDDVPSGCVAIRTGNPDGGVEWYATLPDGSEWGWQAKHVHGIDALLGAMNQSVQRVVRDRPNLVKLTFVISSNLTTSTRAGSVKSQRQKYDDKVTGWKATVDGAVAVDFALVQGSELLSTLALPEHRGRAWFWWTEPVLTHAWLNDRLAEQADAAGEKYRPDLQIDLPIQDDLKALGFDDSVIADFERLRRRLVSAGRQMMLKPAGPRKLATLHRRVIKSAAELVDVCDRATLQAGTVASTLEPLSIALERFSDDLRNAAQVEYDLDRKWRELPTDEPGRDRKTPPDQARSFSVQQARDAATDLQSWIASSVGQALQRGLYFLVGPAGSGKTHLFLDAAQRALRGDRPAVVLAGARFGLNDLWASICDQLGLEPLGSEMLLGAMNSAGEAAAQCGRRFVILVDALNETPTSDFWHVHLPTLRAAVARWPHVALAVSCRDTYLDVVDDGTERSHYEQRTHPGFAGREVEATQRYFEHYGLEAPLVPLLVPEFSLPLFLRMYCESLSGSRQPGLAVGHEGRVRIFERYLDVKLTRVARRLRPTAGTGYEVTHAKSRAARVVDAFLDELALTGREATSRERGEELAAAALNGSAEDAAAVLGGLHSEGVFSLEPLYLGDGKSEQGFRIVFQAFADFLILQRRFEASADPEHDADLKKWLLDDCSWGIVEAAAVAFPELLGVELPDYLGLKRLRRQRADDKDSDSRRRSGRARNVYRSVVETLPYRDSTAVTDRTVELLNESLAVISAAELFRTIFLMAPQPANPLNGERLHRYLLQFTMPRRDAYFGFATYHEIWDESSPAATLARWASNGPYPAYDPRVIELACIPLAWLLSSPNRFMRDWVTKSLVQLLRGHLDVARMLLNRFWEVDDPYVTQRVVAVVYGALMRSNPADSGRARKLTALVRKLVFSPPVRADELLLDSGRGIIEWAVDRKLMTPRALADIRRPYGLAPPTTPPAEATLERKYGFKRNQAADESYSSIWSSVLGLGDFGRYVIEPGVHYFSRHRLDKPFPEPEQRQPRRFVKSRWQSFVKSLTDTQREALQSVLEKQDSELPNELALRIGSFRTTLTTEQSPLLSSVWREPTRRWRDDDYPADRAQRWIFRRTLSLGWTPKLFGAEDRVVGHRHRGREEHKAERWGKKYQWMAYHELLARVADNFHASRHYDHAEPYEGLHQMIGDREIDPSLPPIEYRTFADLEGQDHAGTWRRPPISITPWPPVPIDFRRYHGDTDSFIADRQNEPTLDRMLLVTDSCGDAWIVLDANISQGDPTEHEHWRGLQQPFALDTWFVSKDESARLLPHLAALRQHDRTDIIDTHGHVDCCYAGEVGWSPHRCHFAHRDFRDVEVDGHTFHFAPTTETVSWEGSLLDCSIRDTAFAATPSSFIQRRSTLVLDERGPCWLAGDQVVFTNYYDDASPDRRRALLVRASWLRKFLHDHDLELVGSSWHQRWSVHEHATHGDPWENVYAAVRLDADLNVQVAETIREAGPSRGGDHPV